MNIELKQQLTECLCAVGPDKHSFTITETDRLVDDEDCISVLVTIQFKPFHTDDGEVSPEPVTLQIDQYPGEDDEFHIITGEDDLNPLSPEYLYAIMFFSLMSSGGQ